MKKLSKIIIILITILFIIISIINIIMISYSSNYIDKDVNYDEKTVDGSMDGTVLSANVTYHTGMDQLCGFFWDGISTLKPYMDKIEL